MRAKFTGLAGLILAAMLVGCGSDSTGPALANGSLSAKIDGSTFNANAAIAATYSGGILAIAGTDTQGRTIGLGGQVTAAGTFTAGATSPTNFSVVAGSAGWQAALTLGSGSFTVTSISTTGAKGTFQFTAGPLAGTGATGNKVVTEGAFDVTF